MRANRVFRQSLFLILAAFLLLFIDTFRNAQTLSAEPVSIMEDTAGDDELLELIEAVTIASNHEGDASIAKTGDSYTVTITLQEEVDALTLTVNNVEAPVTSEDQLTYTATITIEEIYQVGPVQLRVEYEKDGQAGAAVTDTTDGSTVTVVQEENLLSDLLRNAVLIDSTPGRAENVTRSNVNNILDLNADTFSDFRTAGGSGHGSWIAFDLGIDKKVTVAGAKVLARSGFPDRANGVVIQGSNMIDVDPWVDLTTVAGNSSAWQTLTAKDSNSYRYLRVYNYRQWFGSIAEVKIYGEVIENSLTSIEEVSIQSNHPEHTAFAQVGNTVTLSFTTNDGEPINLRATLGDTQVIPSSEDGQHWMAQYEIQQADPLGELEFQILADNSEIVTSTSDQSSVTILPFLPDIIATANHVNKDNYTRLSYYKLQQELVAVNSAMQEENYLQIPLILSLDAALAALEDKGAIRTKINVQQSMVNSSHTPYGGGGTTADNGWRAFDGNTATYGDATGNPSWIVVDFGEGNEQAIGEFRFYPRSGYLDRINGSVLQGSIDGETYVDLHTINGITAVAWHSAEIEDTAAYRYIRHYFASGYTNVAELELYNPLDSDKTLLAYLYDSAASIDLEPYTEASANALSDALAAALLLLDANDAAQGDVDDAVEELGEAIGGLTIKAVVDTSALDIAISDAESLYSSAPVGSLPNQYPQSAKDAFLQAINSAKAVYDNVDADQAAVDLAVEQLETAVQIFKNAKIAEPNIPPAEPGNKDELTAVIAAAQQLLTRTAHIAEGDKLGQYAAGARGRLQAAISEAEEIADNPLATQLELDQAAAQLDQAIEEFGASFITLVTGQTTITIRDLGVLISYYGIDEEHPDWDKIKAADLLNQGEINIQVLAAIAKMILTEWADSL